MGGRRASGRSDISCSDEDFVGRDDHAAADQYEPIKRLALLRLQPPRNPNKPPTPFLIRDILNGHVGKRRRHCEAATPAVIVRPWLETPRSPGSRGGSAGSVSDDIDEYDDDDDDEDEEIEVEEKKPPANQSVSPLDALLKMATKTFDALKSQESQQQGKSSYPNCVGVYRPYLYLSQLVNIISLMRAVHVTLSHREIAH